MVIVLSDLDDPTAPTFVLDGEDGAVKLGMAAEDEFRDLGEFETIHSAMFQIVLMSFVPPRSGYA
jgi:hypothetical protein